MSDSEIIDRLRDIDESDSEVTAWEAKFLDTVLGQTTLSAKQRDVAMDMIKKYGGRS